MTIGHSLNHVIHIVYDSTTSIHERDAFLRPLPDCIQCTYRGSLRFQNYVATSQRCMRLKKVVKEKIVYSFLGLVAKVKDTTAKLMASV